MSEPTTPRQTGADYSPQKIAALQSQFRPLARRYRKLQRAFLIVFGLAIAWFFACAALRKIVSFGWFFGGFAVLFIPLFAMAFLAPALNCPACDRNVERGPFGEFCPECGARALNREGRLRPPNCSSCARTLRRGKSRGYKIRFCTHCGVLLDEKGL